MISVISESIIPAAANLYRQVDKWTGRQDDTKSPLGYNQLVMTSLHPYIITSLHHNRPAGVCRCLPGRYMIQDRTTVRDECHSFFKVRAPPGGCILEAQGDLK